MVAAWDAERTGRHPFISRGGTSRTTLGPAGWLGGEHSPVACDGTPTDASGSRHRSQTHITLREQCRDVLDSAGVDPWPPNVAARRLGPRLPGPNSCSR